MNTLYDMVVMGDINLDWCSQGLLSFPFSELLSTVLSNGHQSMSCLEGVV